MHAAQQQIGPHINQTLLDLLHPLHQPKWHESIGWHDLLQCARQNRVDAILYDRLSSDPRLPASIAKELSSRIRASFLESHFQAGALIELAKTLDGIPWMLLRGPALGASLYGDLALRPYVDLDLLFSKQHLQDVLNRVRAIGFASPPESLDDRYYLNCHLHIYLVRAYPIGAAALEIHWDIDHPFSLLTIPVEEILSRAEPVEILGCTIPMPEPNDLLLLLAAHAVKHVVHLRHYIEQNQPSAIINENELLHFYDIALVLIVHRDRLDWDQIASRARAWGLEYVLRDCLNAVEMLWPGIQPKHLSNIRQAGPRRWRRIIFQTFEVGKPYAFRFQPGAFFRPIRLLDSIDYLIPPADYLRRQYGGGSVKHRVAHVGIASLNLARAACYFLYYSMHKYISKGFTKLIRRNVLQ